MTSFCLTEIELLEVTYGRPQNLKDVVCHLFCFVFCFADLTCTQHVIGPLCSVVSTGVESRLCFTVSTRVESRLFFTVSTGVESRLCFTVSTGVVEG